MLGLPAIFLTHPTWVQSAPCDTKSHAVSAAEERLPSGECPQPVPAPAVRRWQRRGAKRGRKPKERGTHPPDPGKGKTGRANVSESLLRHRQLQRSRNDGYPRRRDGPTGAWFCASTRADTSAPVQRGRPPRSHLTRAKRGNPDGVWSRERGRARPTSRLTVRAAEHPSRTGTSQKPTPPAERHGEDIPRWIGPRQWRDPRRKAADGDVVSHPKSGATIANGGRS